MPIEKAVLEAWSETPRTITLTNGQICKLDTYILLTTSHREETRKYEKFMVEFWEEEGKPELAEIARKNVQYYEKLEEELQAIRKVLDTY